MSLRKKFLQKILPPLLLGILITSVISTTFLLNFSLKIVDDNSENILSAEYSSIKSVSDSLALGMSEFFHSKLSSLEGLLNLAENINLEASNKMIITNKTLLNAYKISTNEENIRLYPDFIEKWNVTMSRSMWYKDSNTLNISQLSDSERKNLEFARLLEPSLRSIYGSTISLSSIYILFMETGLQFIYPAMIRDRYLNYKSKRFCPYTSSKQTEYFDMRCLGSTTEGIEFLNNGFLNTTMFVSRPFYMFDYNHVQLSMCGVHYSNLSNKNFSLISPENRKIEFFICGDYILKDLDNMLYGITASHKGYYYIVNSFGYVFYHPTFGIKDFFNDNRTIYDYEFDENDDENQKNKEILEFKQNVVPLIEMFYQIQNKTVDLTQIIPKIRYTKNKEEMIGTVSPIFFPITYSFLKYHGCSVIFVENIKIVLDVNNNLYEK